MAETAEASETPGGERTLLHQMLDGIESAGNNVPHPAITLPGLVGMVFIVDIVIGGVVPAWALFAPIVVWYVSGIPLPRGGPVRG